MDTTITNVSNSDVSWRDFLALTKVGIVMSNMITAFAGMYLAAYYMDVQLLSNIQLVIFGLLGSALVMAGGCSLNNYIDRDIDHLMERTNARPTVTGKIPEKQVLIFGLTLSALGILFLLLASFSAVVLGFIGLIFYVVIYTMWTKRTTSLNTIVGSVSGAVPPLIGWAAIDPGLHPFAWVLFLIMFIWQPPHFLALAMKRCEEYRKAGIPMLPVVSSFAVTKRQMVFYVAALIPISLLLAPAFGTVYTSIALLLGVGWLALGLAGFFMKDDMKWARLMFVYSLNYLTIIFILMVVIHIV
ncbi:protoheme IX farnesyltransferase [Anaerobacillus arseniciselenatis]|uniref:Protoheme IX farnesyltransferase n=1 Tax=Anaerobacillus arseniciselenatis TaxID=85682 RepID=A0A1S2LBZ8_9BACI|nr:heme o synthase [Anaerobacillus arseniciselenatis]OIJ10012.1 protoheme IX farnesyltransferase [Anaerobacillus arseniciselenatis]